MCSSFGDKVAGTLGVWTLFDYAGEPGPWPLVASSFGQFDLAGFAKSASYWYRCLWLAAVPASDCGRPTLPAVHVVRVSQSWNAVPSNASITTLDVRVTVSFVARSSARYCADTRISLLRPHE